MLKRAYFRPERADFWPEKADYRPKKADYRPERADLNSRDYIKAALGWTGDPGLGRG